jgi:hypothetical protein
MKRLLLGISVVVLAAVSSLALFYKYETKCWNSPLITEYSPAIRPDTKAGLEISDITLQRHGCYGSCPVYTVTFKKDGSAKYVGLPNYFGRANGNKIGTYYGATKEFTSLAAWIESHSFARLQQDCANGAEDTEVVTTTVVIRGKPKTVTVCDSSKAPEELQAIYKAIDDAASRITWQKQQSH